MPKIKKQKPNERQKPGPSEYVEGVRKLMRERESWPDPTEEQWFKKQDEIPVKIYAYPPPAQPYTQIRRGEVVYFEYARDFERTRKLFEKRIRERTIRYLKGRPGTKLVQADWNDFAVQAIAESCNEALQDLDFLISIGNQKAAAQLGIMTRDMVKRVIAISDSHASGLKAVAEHSINWPVLRGKKSFLHDGEQFLKSLNVGGKVPFNEEILAMLPDTKNKQMMKLACSLLNRLDDWRQRESGAIHWGKCFSPPTKAEENAASLPQFSKDTWPVWVDRAWEILMEENNDHPENNQKLRRFGQYREKHTEVTSQLPSGELPSGKIPTTHETNIRDGIKKRLQDAIKVCAGIKSKQKVKAPAIT